MLLALKKLYEARIAEHTSIIDIYLQKPVGIGEHDDLLKVLDERFQKLTCAKDNLEKLEKIINGVQTKTETKTETKTKK
jgi:D-serine deaminase-like pyridoxal phosphate-dependent protein